MSSLDLITVLRNPEQNYWHEIVELAVLDQGWINSVHDYTTFKNAFPDKFVLLVAVDKETQAFVGSICVSTYVQPEPALSIIGMFLVKPEHRGKGIGRHLFEEAMKLCAQRKFLYSVENMVSFYRDRYGFNKSANWHVVSTHTTMSKVKPLQLNHDPTLTVKKPGACGWDKIAKYYRKFLPQLDAGQFIKSILSEQNCHCGVAVTSENQIVGLVRVRETYKKELSVGPLLGNDVIAACTTLREILCRLETLREFKTFSLQFPSTNDEVHGFMHQMTDGEYKIGAPTYPLFTDEVFELPVHHVYAISESDVAIV